MLFTRMGTFVAHLLVWGGLLNVAQGVYFLFGERWTTADGQPWPKNPGQMLDNGVKYFLIGLALGVLCEIASKKNRSDD